MAIATSSNAAAVAKKRVPHGYIFDRMKTVVTGDQVKNGKPAPDIFLLAAEKIGLDPAECVVVEDSPAGVQVRQNILSPWLSIGHTFGIFSFPGFLLVTRVQNIFSP
jgi:HAD superfamily hydrolase (TIGR01509 family)